jgi:hypothetical protein
VSSLAAMPFFTFLSEIMLLVWGYVVPQIDAYISAHRGYCIWCGLVYVSAKSDSERLLQLLPVERLVTAQDIPCEEGLFLSVIAIWDWAHGGEGRKGHTTDNIDSEKKRQRFVISN